jgi:hypothetical protein
MRRATDDLTGSASLLIVSPTVATYQQFGNFGHLVSSMRHVAVLLLAF